MLFYLSTIARQGGLTTAHLEALTDHFDVYQKCVVVAESHKSGLKHLHAFTESDHKTRAGVRNKLVRFCKTIPIEVGPKTVNVKDADVGARSYVMKDVTEAKPPLLLKGWTLASLLQERQLALKKMTVKQAKGDDKVLAQDEVVPLIISFSKSSTPITDKNSFIDTVIAMVKMGYSFSRIKMQATYAEVMCRLGDERAERDLWEMALVGMR